MFDKTRAIKKMSHAFICMMLALLILCLLVLFTACGGGNDCTGFVNDCNQNSSTNTPTPVPTPASIGQ